MGRNELLETFKENKNLYVESTRRVEDIIREETEKQNISHGIMLQLYVDKKQRDKIIKKAKKLHYNAELVDELEKISNTAPFDIKNVPVTDLEKLYAAEVFTENVQENNSNIFIKAMDTLIEFVLQGKNENDARGKSP